MSNLRVEVTALTPRSRIKPSRGDRRRPRARARQEEIDVLGDAEPFPVAAQRLEIGSAKEHRPGVHPGEPDHGEEGREGDRDSERPAVQGDPGGSRDHGTGGQSAVDGREGLEVDPGIGVDEHQHVASRGPGAAIANRGDDAGKDRHHLAAGRAGSSAVWSVEPLSATITSIRSGPPG